MRGQIIIMDTLIEAQNITVTRQNKDILKDVSIDLVREDFITVVGPNGAGKSMLLKCLMGFYPPDSGTIERSKNLRTGYVPQSLLLDHRMPISAERFLTLHKKISSEDLRVVVHEIGIEHTLKQPLSVLSGGELQRVLLARSLLGNPELLILDEPAQNLDIAGQIAFYKLLQRIYAERSLTILMVSHDLHMVMAATKQVVCLFHHICCSGEPHTVTKDPEFISLFGDDMNKMLAVYQHHHDHTHNEGGDHV